MLILGIPRSQKVKLFVERGRFKFTLLTGTLFSLVHLVGLLFALFVYVGQTDAGVEFSDLVGVLARCRNLDWASPVVVKVAQSESQVLQINLTNL